jgi:dipeptidyl aminopeptidase/acylaminoacyl peptidase
VLGIDHVDAGARTILLTGVGREPGRNPYYRSLYRVPLDGTQPVLLTPEPLDHETSVSPDGKWFVDAMSSPDTPTRTVVRDARDGRIVAELAKADAGALFATGYTPPEPFRGVAADGKTPLYGMIWRPANFDPSRRYPIIDEVYTGPTTTNVPTAWRDTITAGAGSVAQIGAIVVNIDGRGTSRRGQAFRMPAYQNLGEVGLDDHIAMIRQMAAKYPYIDADRVGVYGGSAGGYDAARFVLRRPGFFKVAVASSGNHDLRLDKAWWPEVSMGNPDPSVWERNSNMSVAKNLVGKLLLIHGDIDDNVPVTESMRLANALITAGRDVDMVILPNTTHRVAQPFFWRKLRDYFTRHLLDEKPPALPLPKPEPAPVSPSPSAMGAALK